MSEETQLTTIEKPITPMELLMSAVQQGAGIDTIERLAKLQRDMMDYDARVGWEESMSRVQQKIGFIRATVDNPQTKSKYATFAQLDGALRPFYSSEDISLSFDTVDCPLNEHVRIVCYVSRKGYTRRYQVDMPITTTGIQGKAMMTETHATGAAFSYGCRYLEKMIFNIAVGEHDNDGNGAEDKRTPQEKVADAKPLTDDQIKKWVETIHSAKTESELKEFYRNAYRVAHLASDDRALQAFTKAKDTRKVLLSPIAKMMDAI